MTLLRLEVAMNEKLLFVIPIYVRDFDQHKIDRKYKKNRFVLEMEKSYKKSSIPVKQEIRNHWEIEFPGSSLTWKYTQIIGVIEILYDGGNLKAYLYLVKAKRFQPNMNKKLFKYEGKIGDVCLHTYSKTNKVITENIYTFLRNLRNRNKLFKKWYLDMSIVENLLPLVNFKKLPVY